MKFELRDYQKRAVEQILSWHDEGISNVFLDAPTGSGKSIIGMSVIEALAGYGGGFYTCSDIALQNQFFENFPQAPIIMGHSRYCGFRADAHTDSTGMTCEDGHQVGSTSGLVSHLVRVHGDSPHNPTLMGMCEHACRRLIADAAPVFNINSAKYFNELVHSSYFRNRHVGIFDEADVLEGALDSVFVRTLGLTDLIEFGWGEPPEKCSTEFIVDLLEGIKLQVSLAYWDAIREVTVVGPDGTETQGHSIRADELTSLFYRIEAFQQKIIDRGPDGVLSWTANELQLYWASPGKQAAEHLWPHTQFRVFMSGTLGSAQTLARLLGLDWADCRVLPVPSTFPVENRLIFVDPVERMISRAWQVEGAVAKIATAIQKYRDGRTLVHVTSGAQAAALAKLIPDALVYSNGDPRARRATLQAYLATPDSLIIAQSMHRGVDLLEDACRTNIIAKVPYPPLGNRIIQARMNTDQDYYPMLTAGKLIQALGRGVRSPDDHCKNYILDSAFVMGRFETLFPRWMQDALVTV
jgi:Rad3-related DNA helicase